MVREARREFFSKHSYDFTTDSTHNLSRTFRELAVSANLLGTSIHEIQASWTGPKELKQVNYALLSLPKGLKFLCALPPSESPKVMGLMGMHMTQMPSMLWWHNLLPLVWKGGSK